MQWEGLPIDRMKGNYSSNGCPLSTGGCLSIKLAVNVTAICVLAGLFSLLAAQQTAPPTNSDASGQSQQQSSTEDPPAPPIKPVPQKDTNAQNTTSGTSNDRLFFTLPNFLTLENAGQVPPLTSKQKFWVVARSSFDYVQYPWYGFLAGISQWEDSEPGFGQGAEGYGKRFGTAFADGTIENFTTSAIFPTLLRQDPRFFQSGRGGFSRRTGYAVSRIFLTRGDSGRTQFNFSEILGSASAAAISTYSYHPKGRFASSPTGLKYIPSDRTLTNTASVWGSEVGYDAITFVVKEFWPDIHRKLSHKPKGTAQYADKATP